MRKKALNIRMPEEPYIQAVLGELRHLLEISFDLSQGDSSWNTSVVAQRRLSSKGNSIQSIN